MPNDDQLSLGAVIQAAQIVVPCADLAALLEFFTGTLGFRLEAIFPADTPETAVISGYGVTLRLETAKESAVSLLALRLLCDLSALSEGVARALTAPNGMRVELVDAQAPLNLPLGEQEFVISRAGDAAAWGVGRAGMEYRDLIPGRWGGRFIASHIRIPAGGPVPDYVHFHQVRFQMIYCKTGWARVVYEDQGPPFVLEAGDCVLQPPEIRHRVLEASPGLEVIEIGCPAWHETRVDHELSLPTPQTRPERLFGGQRFARHIARETPWHDGPSEGWETRGTGIAGATNGLASVRVLRTNTAPVSVSRTHLGEFLFLFVLQGALSIDNSEKGHHLLRAGDSCVIPAGLEFAYQAEANLEMLVVTLPAELPQTEPPIA